MVPKKNETTLVNGQSQSRKTSRRISSSSEVDEVNIKRESSTLGGEFSSRKSKYYDSLPRYSSPSKSSEEAETLYQLKQNNISTKSSQDEIDIHQPRPGVNPEPGRKSDDRGFFNIFHKHSIKKNQHDLSFNTEFAENAKSLSELKLFYKNAIHHDRPKLFSKFVTTNETAIPDFNQIGSNRSRKQTVLDFEKDNNTNWVEKIEMARWADENEISRDNWIKEQDFVSVSIAVIIGPFTISDVHSGILRYGGISYIIPHLTWLFIFGCPLLLLEIAIGQYTSRGPLHMWNCAPLLKGTGYLAVLLSFVFNVVKLLDAADYALYVQASVNDELPILINGSFDNLSACTSRMHEYYLLLEGKSVNEDSESKDFKISEKYIIVNFLICVIIACSMIFGIPTIGRICRIKAYLRYVYLIPFFIYSLTLPGAFNGIRVGFRTLPAELGKIDVWALSLMNVFGFLSLGAAVHSTYASYNKFKASTISPVLVICVLDTFTSSLFALVYFALFGHDAFIDGIPIDKELETLRAEGSGSGSHSNVIHYPCLLADVNKVWRTCFFINLFLYTVDWPIHHSEVQITSLIDYFSLRKPRRKFVTIGVAFSMFLLSIPLSTPSGRDLITYSMGGLVFNFILIGICNCIGVGWIYGAQRFVDDIELMVGYDVTMMLSNHICKGWWVLSWKYLAPLCLLIFLIRAYIIFPLLSFGTGWVPTILRVHVTMGYLILAIAILIQLLLLDGSLRSRLKKLLTPSEAFGPGTHYYRTMVKILGDAQQKWIQQEMSSTDTLRRDAKKSMVRYLLYYKTGKSKGSSNSMTI